MAPAGSSLMESLFQRSLDDLIKGLRLHSPASESSFISKSLDEIRREISSTDLPTKSTALQKLTYLHSLHSIDISWAAFHAVELTSSPVFLHKKIAYLAISLSFHSTTPVILLLTNQLRKALSSPNPHELSLALDCLANICTTDLALSLTPDLFTLLSSTNNFVKKKAIATLLSLFIKYPDSIRVCFKRLVDNLSTSDPTTLSATMGVFCQLVLIDPTSYLPLAPEFYTILVDCRNNWVLIKVLKVFAKLVTLEPRLGKKVVEPICEHMRRSGAKSLVFECVRTIVVSLGDYDLAVKLAVEKIGEFLAEEDPNLKYLGLQALSLVAGKHLWAVLENKEMVIKSLSDEDRNIKLEALRLVMAMVSEDNVGEICRVLLNYALKSDPDFCNEIIRAILLTCGRNVYEIVMDFDWYVGLLGEMARIPHSQKGEEIENQLIDIGMRVTDVRPQLVRVSCGLLIDPALLGNQFIHKILSAAAWLSGEYAHFSKNPFELMEALLQPRTNLLPASIRAVYIQSALKLLTFTLYSYLYRNKAASPPVESEITECSGLVENISLVDSEQDEEFNPVLLSQSIEDTSTENGEDTTRGHTSSSAAFKKDLFTQESIVKMLTLVETVLSPLAGSHEVEIQERVRNVLSLVELMKREIPGCFVQNEENFEKEELKSSEIMRLMYDAFSEELGPVSVTAQERVPIPDGLILEENLNNLRSVCDDIQLPIPSLFSLGRTHVGGKHGLSLSNSQSKEESESSMESTALLSEHRKRHGLFYLSSDKKDTLSHDYPPANDLKLRDDADDDTKDLVKLTEQLLVPKKKINQAKPRPVVVKLNQGDGISVAAKKPILKDDMISGAVRDVLLGNEDSSPSQGNTSTKSNNTKGKEKLNVDQCTESKDDLANAGTSELGTSKSRSRRSKHKSHGKERKDKTDDRNLEGRDKKGQRDKQRSFRHGGDRARQRADGDEGVTVSAQTAVVPDFLL